MLVKTEDLVAAVLDAHVQEAVALATAEGAVLLAAGETGRMASAQHEVRCPVAAAAQGTLRRLDGLLKRCVRPAADGGLARRPAADARRPCSLRLIVSEKHLQRALVLVDRGDVTEFVGASSGRRVFQALQRLRTAVGWRLQA